MNSSFTPACLDGQGTSLLAKLLVASPEDALTAYLA